MSKREDKREGERERGREGERREGERERGRLAKLSAVCSNYQRQKILFCHRLPASTYFLPTSSAMKMTCHMLLENTWQSFWLPWYFFAQKKACGSAASLSEDAKDIAQRGRVVAPQRVDEWKQTGVCAAPWSWGGKGVQTAPRMHSTVTSTLAAHHFPKELAPYETNLRALEELIQRWAVFSDEVSVPPSVEVFNDTTMRAILRRRCGAIGI